VVVVVVLTGVASEAFTVVTVVVVAALETGDDAVTGCACEKLVFKGTGELVTE